MAFDFSSFLSSLGQNFAQNAGGGMGGAQSMPMDQKLLNVASILQGKGMPQQAAPGGQGGMGGQPDMDALRRMIMSFGNPQTPQAQPPVGLTPSPGQLPARPDFPAMYGRGFGFGGGY